MKLQQSEFINAAIISVLKEMDRNLRLPKTEQLDSFYNKKLTVEQISSIRTNDHHFLSYKYIQINLKDIKLIEKHDKK